MNNWVTQLLCECSFAPKKKNVIKHITQHDERLVKMQWANFRLTLNQSEKIPPSPMTRPHLSPIHSLIHLMVANVLCKCGVFGICKTIRIYCEMWMNRKDIVRFDWESPEAYVCISRSSTNCFYRYLCVHLTNFPCFLIFIYCMGSTTSSEIPPT